MFSLKFIVPQLALAAAVASAQTKPETSPISRAPLSGSSASANEADKAEYRNLAHSGNAMYRTGSIISWAGAAGAALAGVTYMSSEDDSPVFGIGSFVGMLGLMIGPIFTYMGANDVETNALSYDPQAKTEGRLAGPFFWSSLGLYTVGAFIAGSFRPDESTYSNGEFSPKVKTLMTVMAGGLACGVGSWYQSSRKHAAANSVLASVSVQPVPYVAQSAIGRPQGIDGGGLKLVLRF